MGLKEPETSVSPLREFAVVESVVGIDISMHEALPRQAQERHPGGRVCDAEGVGDVHRVRLSRIREVLKQVVLRHERLLETAASVSMICAQRIPPIPDPSFPEKLCESWLILEQHPTGVCWSN